MRREVTEWGRRTGSNAKAEASETTSMKKRTATVSVLGGQNLSVNHGIPGLLVHSREQEVRVLEEVERRTRNGGNDSTIEG